jgi:hypothetical protein
MLPGHVKLRMLSHEQRAATANGLCLAYGAAEPGIGTCHERPPGGPSPSVPGPLRMDPAARAGPSC